MSNRLEHAEQSSDSGKPVHSLVDSSMTRDEQLQISRKLWQNGTGGSDSAARQNSSVAQMLGGLEIVEAKGAKVDKGDKAGAKPQAAVQDAGIKNLNDADAQLTLHWATFEQQQKAKAIKDEMMSGKDVSEMLNKLSRDERTTVMTIIKSELAKTPGTSVLVTTNDDRSRDLLFVMKGGAKVRISEDTFGQPQDIQVAGVGWRTSLGAKDVYDRPGENKGTSSGAGVNPLSYLRGQTQITEGNGPAARLTRGEEISAEDWKQLEEMARKSGGRIYFVKPMGADQ